LTSGQGLRRVLKGAKMVTVVGGVGHGIYGTKSCADKTATAYLTTGELPVRDATCQGSSAVSEPRSIEDHKEWSTGCAGRPA
jgi:hypothetical protein